MTTKDLKKLGLIPRTKAYEQQMILAKYLYVFLLGIVFAELFM